MINLAFIFSIVHDIVNSWFGKLTIISLSYFLVKIVMKKLNIPFESYFNVEQNKKDMSPKFKQETNKNN